MYGRRENFKYVSEGSSEYIAEREKVTSYKKSYAYGETGVVEYDKLSSLLKKVEEEGESKYLKKNKLIEQRDDIFTMDKKYLSRYLENDKRDEYKYTIELFEEGLQDEDMALELKKLGDFDNGVSAEVVKDLLDSEKINDELFVKILRRHTEIFSEKREQFEKQVETLKSDFAQRAREEIKSGYLPISEELLEQRVNETVLQLTDSLQKSDLGAYDDWVATISDSLPEEKRRHASFHELTHAISGRINQSYDQQGFHIIEHRKLGLRIKTRKGEKVFPDSRLAWLTEAITEDVALRLSGEKDCGYYILERSNMGNMIGGGIDEQLFRDAYFENYEPPESGEEVKPENVLPAWKAFVSRVTEVEGKGALKKRSEGYNG